MFSSTVPTSPCTRQSGRGKPSSNPARQLPPRAVLHRLSSAADHAAAAGDIAIFIANDMLIGVMRALHDRGLTVDLIIRESVAKKR